jgi:hypothetical protein
MLNKMLLAVVIGQAVSGMCFGQELPKPGAEHERLKKFAGDWDAVMDAGGQKSKATASYKSICGGMWLESDFEGDFGGLKFQGHGADGYDQRKKKYVGVWVDSMQSAPMIYEGDHDPKTKTTVMNGESVGPDGKPQKFKTTTEMKDDDHFTFKMYMLLPENQEQQIFTIEYTRRK